MRMRLINFRAFRDTGILDFGEEGGVSLVYGVNKVADYADSNGVGKTTLMNGLIWTLFGKHPGLAAATKVISSQAKRGESCIGEVTLPTNDGTFLLVRRMRSKSANKIHVGVVAAEDVAGTDMQELPSWDADVAQEKIDEAVGLNYDRFVKLVAFTGEFHFAGQGDAAMKALLASLCPVNVDSAMKEANARRTAASNAKITAETRKRDIDARLQRQREEIAQTQNAEHGWHVDHSARLTAAQQAVPLAEQAALQADADATAAAEAHRGLQAPQDAPQQLERARGALASVTQLWAQLSASLEGANTRTQTPRPSTACPTCAQPLPEDKRLAIEDAWARGVREAQAEVTALQPQVEEAHRKSYEAQAEVTRLEGLRDREESREAAQAAQEADRLAQASTAAAHALAHAREAVVAIQAETNPYEHTRRTLEQNLARMVDEQAQFASDFVSAETALEFWEYVAVLTGKKGLNQFALAQMLPVLSETTNRLLAEMSPEHLRAYFLAETAKGSEKFHVHAESAVGASAYGELSAGERRRIDAAAFLAVFELTKKSLRIRVPLFLDELLDASTDQTGKATMLEMLSGYAAERSQPVLVVTNDMNVMGDRRFVSHVVSVVKEADGSRVQVA